MRMFKWFSSKFNPPVSIVVDEYDFLLKQQTELSKQIVQKVIKSISPELDYTKTIKYPGESFEIHTYNWTVGETDVEVECYHDSYAGLKLKVEGRPDIEIGYDDREVIFKRLVRVSQIPAQRLKVNSLRQKLQALG